jgi:hypothetical protein
MRGKKAARTGTRRSLALVVVAGLAPWLAGCADMDDALFGPDQTQAEGPSQTAGSLPGSTLSDSSAGSTAGSLPVSTGSVGTGTMASITPVSIDAGSDTGTAVGHKIQELRSEIAGLQEKISASAQQLSDLHTTASQAASSYHEAKAHITTRLQMGTTRGNPELVGEWNSAQSALDQMTGNINALNALGTAIAGDASRAHYAQDTISATFNVSGAVDEDHRQLSVLQDETSQTIVLIDRLLSEVSVDVQRQTAYVANERANLTTLANSIKNGELYGAELGSVMTASAAPAASYGPSYASAGAPLVTIKFDHPGVEYQQILYTALAQALQSRPAASFDVIAVSPTRGTLASVQLAQTDAQRHAQDVLRSMTDMGVPSTRLAVSSATDPAVANGEVRVYVR